MVETWDSIADWYVDHLRKGSALNDFNRDVLLDQLPTDLTGRHLLDLGYGEGLITRAAAARGAHTSGTVGPDGAPHRVTGDYLDEGFWRSANPNGVRRAGNRHRTLAGYLNALLRHGFTLDAVAEPAPSAAVTAQQPQRAGLPPFLVVRARTDTAVTRR